MTALKSLPFQDIITQLIDAAAEHGPHAKQTVTLRQEALRRMDIFDDNQRKINAMSVLLTDIIQRRTKP